MLKAVIYSMILNFIQAYMDPLPYINKNGLNRVRSTPVHVIALNRTIEGLKSHNL